MDYNIEILENRLECVNKLLKAVVTDVMKKEYSNQKEDLELGIHNLKKLNNI